MKVEFDHAVPDKLISRVLRILNLGPKHEPEAKKHAGIYFCVVYKSFAFF